MVTHINADFDYEYPEPMDNIADFNYVYPEQFSEIKEDDGQERTETEDLQVS